MKLELIKETDYKGKIWYYVHKDNIFLSGTMTNDEEQARKIYETVKAGLIEKKEVIISENI